MSDRLGHMHTPPTQSHGSGKNKQTNIRCFDSISTVIKHMV